jgi:hypothetical protein
MKPYALALGDRGWAPAPGAVPWRKGTPQAAHGGRRLSPGSILGAGGGLARTLAPLREAVGPAVGPLQLSKPSANCQRAPSVFSARHGIVLGSGPSEGHQAPA